MTEPPAEPSLAATVLLLRPGPDGPEVLLIHRPSSMAFGPGLHVFPGGKVDVEDGDPAVGADATAAARALGDNLPPVDALAVHRAALRELEEEAGIRLDGVDRLVPLAHWTTPRFMPRRFSTWFFAADLPDGAEPVFAPAEVAAHRWVTAAAALDQMAAGQIDMWVPTTSTLEILIATGAGRAADIGRVHRLGRVRPPVVMESSAARTTVTFRAAGGVPGRTGTATLHGRREIVLVDPGDATDAALDAILDVLRARDGVLRAIVLTAPDPDHAAGAEALAIPLEAPILVAPGAGRHLPYETREVADGERVPCDSPATIRLGPAGSGRLEVVVG